MNTNANLQVLGFVTGVVHGIDGYFAYRYLQIGQ